MATSGYSLSSPQWFTAAVTTSTSASSRDSICNLNHKVKAMKDEEGYQQQSCLGKAVVLPKKKKNRKPVKFDESEGACIVHQLESNEDVDRQQLWFSKQEIRAIRQEGRNILAKVNDAGGDLSTLDKTNGESIRGLEHGLSVHDYDRGWGATINEDVETAPLDRSERRKNIVSTILAQQQEQKEQGIDDPKGLQVTSKACTQWARDRALDQAEKDFEDAVQVWGEDAACVDLLPSILNKKPKQSVRRSTVLSRPSECMTVEERKATLATISQTVASALEELDDLDF